MSSRTPRSPRRASRPCPDAAGAASVGAAALHGCDLHCYAPDDVETRRYLVLRDHLRSHPDDRDRYAAVKRDLATREWGDMNYYAEAKGPVIHEILARAGWVEP